MAYIRALGDATLSVCLPYIGLCGAEEHWACTCRALCCATPYRVRALGYATLNPCSTRSGSCGLDLCWLYAECAPEGVVSARRRYDLRVRYCPTRCEILRVDGKGISM